MSPLFGASGGGPSRRRVRRRPHDRRRDLGRILEGPYATTRPGEAIVQRLEDRVLLAPVLRIGAASQDNAVDVIEQVPTALVDAGASLTLDDPGDKVVSAVVTLATPIDAAEDFSFSSPLPGSISSTKSTVDGALVLTLQATNPDGLPAPAFLAALQSIRYVYSSDAPSLTPRVVTFVVTDGSDVSSNDATATVTILLENDAPRLTAGAPSLPAIRPDVADAANVGMAVADLVAGRIVDPDGPAVPKGIAVTGATAAGAGKWQYSVNSGATWLDLGSPSNASARLLPDAANYRLRFRPDGSGGGVPTLTFRAWDRTSGVAGDTADTIPNGGTTAFSQVADTTRVLVNSAPILADASPVLPTIDKDTPSALNPGLSVATLISGQVTDPDGAGVPRGIAIVGASGTGGTWQYSVDSGANWLPMGLPSDASARLLSDAAENRVRFQPDGSVGGPASLSYRAWDLSTGATGDVGDASTTGGSSSYSVRANTASLLVNAAPVLAEAAPRLPAITKDVTDAQNAGTSIAGLIAGLVTDEDGASALKGVAIVGSSSAGIGAWEYSTNGGATWTPLGARSDASALLLSDAPANRVRFDPDGTSGGVPTLSFRAWDRTVGASGEIRNATPNGGTSAFSERAIDASVLVNSAPVLGAASPSLPAIEKGVADAANTGVTVASLIAGLVTDPDGAGALRGIAIDGVTTANIGRWQYSVNSGATWLELGTPTASDAPLLTDAGTNRVRFLPNGSGGGVPTLSYRAWDQTSGTPGQAGNASATGGATAFSERANTASVLVNSAPVLAAASPVLPRVVTLGADADNVGVGVATLIAGLVTDGDGASARKGVAIIGATTGGVGTWQYSTDGGASWLDLGTPSDASARLLSDAATSRVRLRSNRTTGGTATLTFRAWDGTAGTAGLTSDASATGGTTAFSTRANTASVLVNAAPVLAVATPVLAAIPPNAPDAQNLGVSVASLVAGLVTDPDGAASPRGIAVVNATGPGGKWQYSTNSGASWTDFDAAPAGAPTDASARLLSDAPANRVRFRPDASSGGTPTLSYRAWDQTTGTSGGTGDASSTGGATAFSVQANTASVSVPTPVDLAVGGMSLVSNEPPLSILARHETLVTFVVTNASTEDVTSFVVTDRLTLGGGGVVQILNAGASPAGNGVVVTRGDGFVQVLFSQGLAAGHSVTISAVVRPSIAGTLTSTATISDVVGSVDIEPGNDATSASATVGDAGLLSFRATSLPQNEGDDGFQDYAVVVERTATTGIVTARLLIGGDATRNHPTVASDYEIRDVSGLAADATSFTLAFADGEASRTFTVRIFGDRTIEADQLITFTLDASAGAITGGAEIDPAKAVMTVTIVNDDFLIVRSGNGNTDKDTLYDVLLTANANPAFDDAMNPIPVPILFSVAPGTTIMLAQPLPTLRVPVTIDASALIRNGQPGLIIHGGGSLDFGMVFEASAAGSTARAMEFQGFRSVAVEVRADRVALLSNVFRANAGVGVALNGEAGEGTLRPVRSGTVSGNLFTGNGANLEILGASTSGNLVVGNSMTAATDPARGLGLYLKDAPDNIIGGAALGDRNLLWGNAAGGIAITGASASGNLIRNNYVGLDATGARSRTNGGVGISVGAVGSATGLPGVTIRDNVVSGFAGHGIALSGTSAPLLAGNRVGTDPTGALPIGNSGSGVVATSLTAGTFQDNLVSGNRLYGIHLVASSGVSLGGNTVGLNQRGTTALPNGAGSTTIRAGIFLDGSSNNTLGGTTEGARNVVSGNFGAGVWIGRDAANSASAGRLSSDNRIQGNYLGTTSDGASAPTGQVQADGLVIDGMAGNSIGGPSPAHRNVISGNTASGVVLGNSLGGATIPGAGPIGTVLQGNYIGLKASGAEGLGNGLNGVTIANVAPESPGEIAVSVLGNVISGNTRGAGVVAMLDASGVSVAGNLIGTNAAGTGPVPNSIGVRLTSGANTIGGVSREASERNVISGNSSSGIYLDSTFVSGTLIRNNYIGTDFNGASPVGNRDGIVFREVVNTAGSPLLLSGNVISGNANAGVSLGAGTSGVKLAGNWIGTNAAGTGAVPNDTGVWVSYAPGNIIGGPSASETNVISGNRGSGIAVDQSTGTIIRGNRIGTDAAGALPLGNGGVGVVLDQVADAVVGGTGLGDGNIIANNGLWGISSLGRRSGPFGTTGATIAGNLIGLGIASGNFVGRGNGEGGVWVHGESSALLVGNAIGANAQDGVWAGDTARVTLRGNFVGAGLDGASAIGNLGAGVLVTGDASAIIGAEPGGPASDRNVIVANRGGGVVIEARGQVGQPSTIRGNLIGTNDAGAANLGNLAAGIAVTQVAGVTIESNTIAANQGDGIAATSADGLVVRANTIGMDRARSLLLGNQGDGIRLVSTNRAAIGDGGGLLANLIVASRDNGVHVLGASSDNSLNGNTIEQNLGNGVQISATGGLSVVVRDNMIGGNRRDGVLLAGASGVYVGPLGAGSRGNVIRGNGTNGVEIAAREVPGGVPALSVGNVIEANAIDANNGDGVRVVGGRDNRVVRNAIGGARGNSGYGVALLDQGVEVTGTAVLSNAISGNQNSGVLLSGGRVSGNALAENRVENNRNDGVSILSAGPGNLLSGNTIVSNNNNGVLISGTSRTAMIGDFVGTDASGAGGLGNKAFGVILSGAEATDVRGATIANNASHGLVISAGSGNVVHGSVIGLTPAKAALGNGLAGVFVLNSSGNRIGLEGDGNLIGSNKSDGVAIFGGGGNSVQGNVIGFVPLGSGALDRGNEGDGVNIVNSRDNIVGGPLDGQGNAILANKKSGVEIFGGAAVGVEAGGSPRSESNSVLNNAIGAVIAGVNLGNKLHGILIAGSQGSAELRPARNFVGSLPDALGGAVRGNAIVGNQAVGVAIVSADDNVVRGNLISDNALSGVGLNAGRGNRIEGGNTIARNAVDGINVLTSTATSLAGNLILDNASNGVALISSSAIDLQGNEIRGNRIDGVRVEQGSSANRIGFAGGAPNVIVGNVGAGVEILDGGVSGTTASTGNVVANNRIGVDASGVAVPNRFGVLLNNVSFNAVGAAGPRNVISGNRESGVQITGGSANLVTNNLLGLDPTGTAAVPNLDGVRIDGSTSNTIRDNVASGNLGSGVRIAGVGSSGNVLTGNILGADASGTRPIVMAAFGGPDVYSKANRQDAGVQIENAPNNVVGPGNLVLANEVGVRIFGTLAGGNVVTQNQIGPDPSADGRGLGDRLGNFFGVSIDGASSNTLSGNAIERNISVGAEIQGTTASRNLVAKNVVSANGGYGARVSGEGTDSVVRLTAPTPDALVFGVGVYLDAARGNVIGSSPFGSNRKGKGRVREDATQRNVISDNLLVNLLMFNGATNNQVRSNLIRGGRGGGGAGEYGVFLFNSSGNINLVNRKGRFANRIQGHRIAQFRAYDGPVPSQPTTVGSLPKGPRGAGRAPTIASLQLGGPARGLPHRSR